MSRQAAVLDFPRKKGERGSGILRSGGGSPPFQRPPTHPPVSNPHLALFIFLGAETMFFTGLIGAFIVLRLGSPTWPPASQPRLPVEVTAVNTLVLIASGIEMHRAVQRLRKAKERDFHQALTLTALLGILFLTVQGFEWVRLVGFGLTVSTGIYGSTFYTIIGFHGAHVLGAVIWLTLLLAKTRRHELLQFKVEWLELCAMYWYFVVGLWPVIYGLVYLS